MAAFLLLTWALCGAPLGQAARSEDETDDAPGAGYRDRVVAAMVGGLLLVLRGCLPGALGTPGLVVAGLRPGPGDRPDADRRQPSLPAREPEPQTHDRAGQLGPDRGPGGRHPDHRQRDGLPLEPAVDRLHPRADVLAIVHDHQPGQGPEASGLIHGLLRQQRPIPAPARPDQAVTRPVQGSQSGKGFDCLHGPVPRGRAVRDADQEIPRYGDHPGRRHPDRVRRRQGRPTRGDPQQRPVRVPARRPVQRQHVPVRVELQGRRRGHHRPGRGSARGSASSWR